MTIARKLWPGFGGLVLLFLLAGLKVFYGQRSVDAPQGDADETPSPVSP